MDWRTLGRTIEIGRRDLSEVIEEAVSARGPVVHRERAEELRAGLDAA
jgi:hypothetical protein